MEDSEDQEIGSGCWLRRERTIKPGGSGWPLDGPGAGRAPAIGLPTNPLSFYFIHDDEESGAGLLLDGVSVVSDSVRPHGL